MPGQVRDILDKSYKRAWSCLETHRRDLDLLANALIKHETLTGAEIKDVLAGKPIKADTQTHHNAAPSAVTVAKRPVGAPATASAKTAANSNAATARTARGGGANAQTKE